ncbi:MAG: hypothetical protein ACYS17_05850 [Planctomycetota bacterium]
MKSQRPRRQVKKDRKRSLSYVETVFGRQRGYLVLQPAVVEWGIWIGSTIVENTLQIGSFYDKQTQFTKCPNELNFLYSNELYDFQVSDESQKQSQYKPNSKPNKANFGQLQGLAKPKQSQTNPILADKIAFKIYPFSINWTIVYKICWK